MNAKVLSAVRATIRQILKDEFVYGTTHDFAKDELDLHISEALVEVSKRIPYKVKETVYASNKSGQATATTADHLIDTVNAQFVAGDVGKTVYNSTDKTTAKVTAYNSESDLTLDTDIMASGESYYLYCYGGTNGRDFNISSITGLIGDKVEKVEYPTRQWPRVKKDVEVFGDLVTLKIDSEPTDGDEVFLYCHKVHQLTESASTLTADLEKVLVDGAVALTARSWLNRMREQIVPASSRWYHNWANEHYAIYQKGLDSITPAKAWKY